MFDYYSEECKKLSVKIDELSPEKKLEFVKFCIKDCIKPEDLISSKILSQIHNNNCEVVDNGPFWAYSKSDLQHACLMYFNYMLKKNSSICSKYCIYYAISSLGDEAVEKAKIQEYLVLIENFKCT